MGSLASIMPKNDGVRVRDSRVKNSSCVAHQSAMAGFVKLEPQVK